MIHVLQHTEIDKSAWDACIDASPERQIYALSWYLDVVAPGWGGVVEEQAGSYTAVFPLPVKRKWGYSVLQQPLFCQQLGIFSSGEMSASRVANFMAVAFKHFSLSNNYSFNVANTSVLKKCKAKLLHLHHTHCLKLDKPYEQLLKGYTRYRRSNLKKGQSAGLTVAEGTDINPLIALFNKYVAHRIRGGVAEEAYEQLRQLYTELRERKMAQLLYGFTPDGRIVAGAVFLKYGNYITYLFNAADAEGSEKNGRTLILDEIIRQYAGSHYTLDFETPPVEQIAFFYASFGSEPTPFYTWKFNNLPLPIKALKQLRMWTVRKLKG